MTKSQMKLASRLLEEAAGEFIKNLSLKFNLSDDGGMNKDEEKEIISLIELDDFADRKNPGDSYPTWLLMQWLSRVLVTEEEK